MWWALQPSRSIPVSYTHLDVYKRQLLDKEADFLRDRIAGSAKASLLNELASKQKNFSEDWAWQVREDTVSDRNRSILRHAERFSGVMHGASLLYNLLLALRAAERPNAKTHGEASALIENYRQLLEDWRCLLYTSRCV